ncbi:MAG: hypothetical protein IPP66_21985 [Anaerolineales bacterium]|nr:hypothetical protein [Anaerolineales bacterium]
MLKSKRFIMSVLVIGAYLLNACSGAGVAPKNVDNSQSGQSREVVFTGTVESIGDGQLVISGQQVSVDASVLAASNVQVGDTVKVEANVSSDGSVVVLKIEGSGPDDGNANSNDANANDDNANANANANMNDNTNDNSNGNGNANSNDAPTGPEQELFGVVEAITADTITIGGVTYNLANFTEFKNIVAIGDQVKIHVIVNADGTFTIREIEKPAGTGIGGNSNGNGNDDNSNSNGSDDNSNSNGSDDNSNQNSNEDNHNDNDSGGNSNSNDDDSGGGSNSNSNNND